MVHTVPTYHSQPQGFCVEKLKQWTTFLTATDLALQCKGAHILKSEAPHTRGRAITSVDTKLPNVHFPLP